MRKDARKNNVKPSATLEKFLGVRVPQSLWKKMDEVLTKEGFGITEYVKDLLRKDLRKRGMLSPADAAE